MWRWAVTVVLLVVAVLGVGCWLLRELASLIHQVIWSKDEPTGWDYQRFPNGPKQENRQ